MKKSLILFIILILVCLTGCDTKKEETKELNENKCTFNGELKPGVEYVNGQYTYYYNESKSYENGSEVIKGGWKVILTDKESREPVTTKLCSSINDKPITSMSRMFYGSKAKSVDFSSFNTSNVTEMREMFTFTMFENLDLSSFDTSNVTDMGYMFASAGTYNLDLSSFNTSNVTDMGSMFANSKIDSLDLSNFDLSKVKYFTNMLCLSNAVKNNKVNYGNNYEQLKDYTCLEE